MSIIVCISYIITSLTIKNSYISNALIFSIWVEAVLILPISYKLLNLPYDNYLNYKKGHD
jgi:accessory gene regulator protein AgrB